MTIIRVPSFPSAAWECVPRSAASHRTPSLSFPSSAWRLPTGGESGIPRHPQPPPPPRHSGMTARAEILLQFPHHPRQPREEHHFHVRSTTPQTRQEKSGKKCRPPEVRAAIRLEGTRGSQSAGHCRRRTALFFELRSQFPGPENRVVRQSNCRAGGRG